MLGIKDWQEEVTYLDNQLSRSQVGCPSGFDFRQRKRDNRIIEDMTARARVAPKCLMCLKKSKKCLDSVFFHNMFGLLSPSLPLIYWSQGFGYSFLTCYGIIICTRQNFLMI